MSDVCRLKEEASWAQAQCSREGAAGGIPGTSWPVICGVGLGPVPSCKCHREHFPEQSDALGRRAAGHGVALSSGVGAALPLRLRVAADDEHRSHPNPKQLQE